MEDGYLGRYRLDELLGTGGSAQVWRAHDTLADRTVSLKVLAPVLTSDPVYRQRFTREARAAAQLHGPHVLALHTFGELEGRLFIESEFVDGLDLAGQLEWKGPMPPDAAVELITQIATALDEAHAIGLVHRDIKPQNIIVGPDDVAYLIDFGTVQQDGQTGITQIGMTVGTPAYMAPEQFDGAATARSDIYSLACVLYEALTGQRPFRTGNPAQLMRAHLDARPPRASALEPAVPTALDDVIAHGMAKDPNQRPSSAGEFAAAARIAADAALHSAEALRRVTLPASSALPGSKAAIVPNAVADSNAMVEPDSAVRTVELAIGVGAAEPTRSGRGWADRSRREYIAAILVAVVGAGAVLYGVLGFGDRTSSSQPRIPMKSTLNTTVREVIPPPAPLPETTSPAPPVEAGPPAPATEPPAPSQPNTVILPSITIPNVPLPGMVIPGIPLPGTQTTPDRNDRDEHKPGKPGKSPR